MKDMNNTTAPEQRWKVQVAKLKLIYSHLDNDDFKYDYGQRDVMMDSLCKKLGKSRIDLDALLAQL